MTDLAFIVDTSDAAMPSGPAAGRASSDSTGTGSFSGMLGERLQSGPAMRAPEGEATPKTMAGDVNAVVESGASEPNDGKPLPVLPSQAETPVHESSTTGLADAAFLAAIAQTAPRDPNSAIVATAVDASDTKSAADAGFSQPSNLAGSLLNTLTGPVPAARMEAHAAQPAAATTLNAQLPAASMAKQFISATLDGAPAEKQNARPDTGRVNTANITPSLLAQPVSESAQRALMLAMNEAGLRKRVAPSIAGQAETSLALNARQSNASPLSNGLTTAMQMAAVTAKTAFNNGLEASAANTRLDTQQTATLTSVTPLAMAASADDVSGLLPVGQRLSSAVGGGFMPTMPVSTPVGQAGWANELGQRVAWLAQGELREAQLQLHPRSLGPVEVRIAYGHEQQLNVSFTAANPVAREALDAALPRLREMFEQQGLNLADANISQHSFSDQQHQEGDEGASNSNSGNWSAENESLSEQAMLSRALLMGDGLLDAYA